MKKYLPYLLRLEYLLPAVYILIFVYVMIRRITGIDNADRSSFLTGSYDLMGSFLISLPSIPIYYLNKNIGEYIGETISTNRGKPNDLDFGQSRQVSQVIS
jgi:hypothetical protein